MSDIGPLLRVDDLEVVFTGRGGKRFQALDGVSLDIRPGETVGLVGESGSGKTTIGRAILGLVPASAGRITFDGRDITRLPARERRELAKDIQVVFQDPYTSLNPSMTIADILAEPLLIQGWTRNDAYGRVRELLDRVHLPSDASSRLPREFSGGQRQRIAIARAIALGPRLIICDEPVSALDLTTQARVLDLLVELQEDTGAAYLFVSHDLGVVRHISHRVTVLYRGDIVEQGDVDQVTARPEHPYTQRLFMSAPVADVAEQRARRERRRQLAAEGEK
ncbi:ATP-binding cassette domain-containing protein [Microbacterium karelineae]|uniref:ATP-binding cassette domain-containing protein n=1 Tax=Microbacterium karelineae TaxID=2654283 RepID=UPI0012EAB2F1|nr:ABC transporter ATP-binding protein [Microbacterium karelineae]